MKRFAGLVLLLLVSTRTVVAGGPRNVAGVSTFNEGVAGTPIKWDNGQVSYYTDQGDLSALLPSTAADQFVADAFSRWTEISTVALHATRAGALDEDVNGTSVYSLNGTLYMPTDLQSNSAKAVAIVYDADGRVMDAFLGAGAGASELCSTNSIYAQIDRFSADAHIAHALVIINGNCATTTAQLSILKYRLVRTLGQVLGLDYSQLNDNVVFGWPVPGANDYAGFPVMHPLGVLCTEANCILDADAPRMDDRAALSRLYPVTAANLFANAGKQISRDNTGRVFGSVRFPSYNGATGQGMQGVNVVARMVDPATSRVSRSAAASCVSGFLFRGTAGNPMTGNRDALGRPLDAFGSNDTALQGFFDLAGLEVPSGYTSVIYELSVEPVNPLYVDSSSVGPYRKQAIAPSGSASPVRVTVSRGGEVAQDIVLQGGAAEASDQYEPSTFTAPAPVPGGGDWVGSLSGYGDLDYFYLTIRASRTFTIDVTAIDANGLPTDAKAQPLVGIWHWENPEDQPSGWGTLFNSELPDTTRVQGEVIGGANYKIGIADYRGDGRPDFRYEAHVLYADDLLPARASVNGGTTLAVSGLGFSSNMAVQIGRITLPATPLGSNQLSFRTPPLQDATYDVTVIDQNTNATSTMQWALHVGSADAKIVLLSGSNPQVPVGTQAPNPVRVQVLDGATPVAGATVNFTVPSSASIAGCAQSVCTYVTDQNGIASASIVIHAEGPSIIQASLPTGGDTAVTINGIAATLEITLDHPSLYVASGASATLPVTATVVVNGVPAAGQTVNFLLNSGSATILPSSTLTDAKGLAATGVSVSKLGTDVNISACVAPNNTPCRTLIVHPVSASSLAIERVNGDQQSVYVGDSFAPISLRVVDKAANPVSGVVVAFLTDVFRAPNDTVRVVNGEAVTFTRDEPVVLSTATSSAFSDANGMVTMAVANTESQPVQIIVQARAGEAESQFVLRSMWHPNSNQSPPAIVRGIRDAVGEPSIEEIIDSLEPVMKEREASRMVNNRRQDSR